MVNCSLPRLVGGGVVTLAVLLTSAAPLQALQAVRDFTEEELMRFRFPYWTGCSRLKLSVFFATEHSEVAKIGLTQESVVAAVRSRLRAAGLYAGMSAGPPTEIGEDPVLLISFSLINSKIRRGGPFVLDVGLYKKLYDPLSGLYAFAQTNGVLDRAIGQHSGDATYILSSVARMMDRFLDLYLEVNEPACS